MWMTILGWTLIAIAVIVGSIGLLMALVWLGLWLWDIGKDNDY